jgi:hypothetical protein
MNTLIAVGLILAGCGVGTLLALCILGLAELGAEDDE